MFAYIIYVNDLRIGSQAVQFIFLKLGILNIHKTLNLLKGSTPYSDQNDAFKIHIILFQSSLLLQVN